MATKNPHKWPTEEVLALSKSIGKQHQKVFKERANLTKAGTIVKIREYRDKGLTKEATVLRLGLDRSGLLESVAHTPILQHNFCPLDPAAEMVGHPLHILFLEQTRIRA